MFLDSSFPRPSTEHPMYTRSPIIPGDPAYNLGVAILTLFDDWSAKSLEALKNTDHDTAGTQLLMDASSLKQLVETLSTELRQDVFAYLINKHKQDGQ